LKKGGGGLRRWWQIRKSLFELNYSPFTKTNLNKDGEDDRDIITKGKPLTLFDFNRHDDLADAVAVTQRPTQGGWRISDDGVIHGYSKGSMSVVFNQFTRKGNEFVDDKVSQDAQNGEDRGESNMDEPEEDNGGDYDKDAPYIRWTGTIDTRIGPKSRARRSGFCAIRSPEFPGGVMIGNKYNALEITCRPDGRVYTVNLKVASYFPDDLYQGFISAEKEESLNDSKNDDGEFIKFVMPFREFVLTSAGLVREQQRELDGGIELEHIGFTQMDGKDGPFTFDLKMIRVVNYYDGVVIGEEHLSDDEYS